MAAVRTEVKFFLCQTAAAGTDFQAVGIRLRKSSVLSCKRFIGSLRALKTTVFTQIKRLSLFYRSNRYEKQVKVMVYFHPVE